jgi:hypothetical protein
MFWPWLLRYSSIFITGVVSLVVGYLLHRLTTRYADLIYYSSHPQWVTLPPQPNQPPLAPIGTFTLFLWNPGKAPAKDVLVGHYFLPANNVFPDLPRQMEQTPGGGWTIKFPVIPQKTLVSVSYLFFGVFTVEQIISYVGWEEGRAKKIPVILQRVWPKRYIAILWSVLVAGIWVVINALVSLIRFLWLTYYAK